MNLTLNDIEKSMDLNISLQNLRISSVAVNPANIKPSGVFVLRSKRSDEKALEQCREAVKNGAIKIISEMQIEDYDCIITQDATMAFYTISKYYREKLSTKVIAVTGSVGKTSAKDMIFLVLEDNYGNCIKTTGSSNSPVVACNTVLSLKPEVNATVIEMGMNSKGVISKASYVTEPDIAVITNIGYSHIGYFRSKSDILNAKLEILEGMKENGYLIINSDDELLSSVTDIKQTVITVSLEDKSADYYAEYSPSEDDTTQFFVYHNGIQTHVTLNCIGIHNIYNALFSFAVGELLGIDNPSVAISLTKYRTSGIRQNIITYGTNKVIADCYNASPDSINSALKMLSELKPAKSGRRIAVLADMLELGQFSIDMHCSVGKNIDNYPVDMIFCYGELSFYISDSISGHANRIFTSDKDILVNLLRENIKENDIILFKGSHSMGLDKVINQVFNDSPLPYKYNSAVKSVRTDTDTRLFSKSAILVEVTDGEIIASKNADDKAYPFGITNAVTTAVALQYANIDDVVNVNQSALTPIITANTSSNLGIKAGEKYILKELLYAFMITGGNDVANVIAEHISGSVKNFAKLMNDFAKECGATNSNFRYPHGVFNKDHYSSAKDISLIFCKTLKNNIFTDILCTREFTVHPSGCDRKPFRIKTNNPIVKSDSKYYDSRIVGGKGGCFNNIYSLASLSTVKGKLYASVVMESIKIDSYITSYKDTTELLNLI